MSKKEKSRKNISPDFKPNRYDSEVADILLRYEGTPMAVKMFAEFCEQLTDYGYWFFLSTIWVKYTGFSDLQLWKKLFASPRPKRETSVMKPDELAAYRALPEMVTAYRAHRENETDWMSYTTSIDKAKSFLACRPGGCIRTYMVPKADIVAYFLRRGEFELLVCDRSRVVAVEGMWPAEKLQPELTP